MSRWLTTGVTAAVVVMLAVAAIWSSAPPAARAQTAPDVRLREPAPTPTPAVGQSAGSHAADAAALERNVCRGPAGAAGRRGPHAAGATDLRGAAQRRAKPAAHFPGDHGHGPRCQRQGDEALGCGSPHIQAAGCNNSQHLPAGRQPFGAAFQQPGWIRRWWCSRPRRARMPYLPELPPDWPLRHDALAAVALNAARLVADDLAAQP